MPIKTLDDIERERAKKSNEKVKDDISEGIDDIMKDLFGKFKIENKKRKEEKKKNESIFIKILKILGILGLGLLVINFIVGNIWLLRYFIKSFIN